MLFFVWQIKSSHFLYKVCKRKYKISIQFLPVTRSILSKDGKEVTTSLSDALVYILYFPIKLQIQMQTQKKNTLRINLRKIKSEIYSKMM